MGIRRALFPAAALLLTLTACEQKKPADAPAAPASQAAAPAAKIWFGHVGSMTGQEATFGDSTDKGIKLAIEEINAKGGVKGKQIDLKTYDDQGKPEEAAIAITRLITQDKVTVLLGEVASSRSLAMAPIADANKVPKITPSSTNPKVTKDGDKTRPYIFRVCFIDPFQGSVMAKFAKENPGVKKVAILHDVGNAYSVGLADYFLQVQGPRRHDRERPELQGRRPGLQGPAHRHQGAGARGDLRPRLLHRRRRSSAPGARARHQGAAHRRRRLGLAKLLEIGGEAIEGSLLLEPLLAGRPVAARSRTSSRSTRQRYGAMPDAMAALGYDAAMVAVGRDRTARRTLDGRGDRRGRSRRPRTSPA